MRLTGNIHQIKNSRDSSNRDIAVHINTVEYVTQKKDGRYYQAFDFVEELDTPLVITGDCLALIPSKHAAEGEYAFNVFDKTGEDYALNENKHLSLTVAYDYDMDIAILTSASYVITVSNEEFTQIKSERSKARKQKKGRKSR